MLETALFSVFLCIVVILFIQGYHHEQNIIHQSPPLPEERPDEEWIAANPNGAWVVSKRKESTLAFGRSGGGGMVLAGNINKGLDKYCHITFEILSSGERKEYCVPERDYDKIAKGDIGILTVKIANVRFERQAKTFTFSLTHGNLVQR